MQKTLLSRNSLAERWDFTSPDVIAKYEKNGILTRVKDIPVPRYRVDEIERIESLENKNPLSPIERRRLEKKIENLEIELSQYKNVFNDIKTKLIVI